MSNELSATVIQISGLHVDIGMLETQESFIEGEITALNGRKNNVNSARSNDIAAFATR